MSNLSTMLEDAMKTDGVGVGDKDENPDMADKTAILPGHDVVVRTHDGRLVASGTVSAVHPDTNTLKIKDTSSGTHIHIEVDTDKYDVWIQDEPLPMSRDDLFARMKPNFTSAFAGVF